jgi:hypothetical protein
MAYSKFTFLRVREELGIADKCKWLFPEILALEPSEWLKTTLKMGKNVAFFSEKSRSEAIVFPILVELQNKNEGIFSIYSGADLEADSGKELSGECDFILGYGEQKYDLDVPIFCMIEAKDQDLKKALPQCIAQMEGARIFNQKHGKSIDIIWGCVTTGAEWLFLKLEGKTVFIDTERYYLKNVGELLGIFQFIINFYVKNI